MITREQALACRPGDVLYHVTLQYPNGSAVRAEVLGKATMSERYVRRLFALPCVRHLKFDVGSLDISSPTLFVSPRNAHDWCLFDINDVYEKAGVGRDAPWQIVHDRLIDAGHEALAAQYLADLEASALPS